MPKNPDAGPVVVARHASAHEAHVSVALLAAAGIEARVHAAAAASLLGGHAHGLGTVDVLVRAERADAARALLAEAPASVLAGDLPPELQPDEDELPDAPAEAPEPRDPTQGTDAIADTPHSETPQKRGTRWRLPLWVSDHWRGEVAFVQLVFRNGILTLLTLYLVDALAEAFILDASAGLFRWVVLANFVAGRLIGWWWFVGAWRAAARQVRRPGRSGRSLTIGMRLVLVWAVLPGYVVGFAGLPEVAAFTADVLRGDSDARVEWESERHEVLWVVGDLAPTGVDRVVRELEAHARTVRGLGLISDGGWATEALVLVHQVEKRGLTTYAEVGCSSACTAVLLAGKKVVVERQTQIGFHRSSVGNDTTCLASDLTDVYRRHGLPGEMVARACDTPSATLWMPGVARLVEAGVIDEVYDAPPTQ